MQKFTLKTRGVVSNSLFKEISEFVESIIQNFHIVWDSTSQRDAILEIVDELMQDMVTDKKIEQWNVVCDKRNNKQSQAARKRTILDITYKQRNCYNVTELHYEIENVTS